MNAEAPYLVWETRGHTRFTLLDPTTLGRAPGNTLPLDDAGSSSRHANIRRLEGGWILEDLGSTNGTWVNNQKIEQPCPLKDGDRIRIGAQVLLVAGLGAHCGRCGATLPGGSAFCPGCGLPLAASASITNPVEALATPVPPPVPAPSLPPRPSRASKAKASLLYWVFFALFALFAMLLLVVGRGALLYGTIFLLLAVLLVMKKLLSRGILKPVLGFFGACVLALIAFVSTSMPDQKVKANASAMATQKTGDVSVTLPGWVLPRGAQLAIQRNANPPDSPEDPGVVFQAYDIHLPPGADMQGVAEITLPFNRSLVPQGSSPEDAVGAAYYNPEGKVWTPVPCVVDGEKGTVAIYTDHFSTYTTVIFKDGRKKLNEALPPFDSPPIHFFTQGDQEQIFTEMASGATESPTAIEKGWGQFNKLYGLTGASATVLEAVAGTDTLKNVNKLMNEAGLGFAVAQLAFDISKLDNQAAVQNFTKSSAFYAISKWGGDALGLASAGVTFMDLALNEFGEAALDKNQQKWEGAYRRYYETDPKGRRSGADWYRIIVNLHKQSKNAADFKERLDFEVTAHSQMFWKDADGYAHVAESTPGIVGFGAGGETAAGPKKISANYKAYLYKTTLKGALRSYVEKLWFNETMKAEEDFNKLKRELNQVYRVTVQLQNAGAVSNLQACSVRFSNPQGQVIHGQSFDGNGRSELSMSLFGFLKAGGPINLEVSVPAQDSTPPFHTRLTYQLQGLNTTITIPYSSALKVQQPQEKRSEPASNKVNTLVTPVRQPVPPPQKIPEKAPEKQYDYAAALAQWAADHKASSSKTRRDEYWGQDHIYTLEFTVAPHLVKEGSSPGVYGAHQIWDAWSFYTGDRKGQSGRSTVNTFALDAPGGGLYLSLGELKAKYPQFGK